MLNTDIQETIIQEDASKLQQGWRKVRFDQMSESITDRVDNPAEANVEYYVGLEHLDSESLKIRRWGTPDDVEATKLRFKPGDIIFGKRRAYQRKVGVAEFEGICSAHALVLRAREETVLKEFLPFFMQSEIFFERALSISVGSLSPTINWTALARQEFVIPPKDEQRRIAGILWAVDESMVIWEQVLHQIKVLRNDLIDTELLLEKYQEIKLSEVCTRISDGTHVPPQFVSEGVPFLLVSNLASGKINWNVSKWINKETYKELTRHVKPEFGDVLYTVVGSFGVPVLITWDQPFSFQRHIAIIKPDKSKLDGAYLAYFLASKRGKAQAELLAAGNAQRTITLGSLNNFLLPLPTLSIQKQITTKIDHINSEFDLVAQHIQVSKQLKKKILRKLIGDR